MTGKNLKKLFLWSSLGSFALGVTLALARKPKKPSAPPLVYRPIPPECNRVEIWSERYRIGDSEGREQIAREQYTLQPTRFKLWSVLDLGAPSSKPAGTPIYHVTHLRLVDRGEEGEEEVLSERFYGIVSTVGVEGTGRRTNCLARGGILEIDKCYVGGTSNGVLSGETHRSPGPILNYQIH